MEYNKVYDFTNENVDCLKNLYHFENSRVISIIRQFYRFFTKLKKFKFRNCVSDYIDSRRVTN